MDDIVWFAEIDKNDIDLVGGKGANLGELSKINAPVPNGFIVTSSAYFKNIKESGAIDRIKAHLYGINVEDAVTLETKAKSCQQEILALELDPELEKTLFKFYKKMSNGTNAYVAVRSSATAEDLPGASFAGQQATFLNVRGQKDLKEALLGAWASLFEARAIFYRANKNFDHFKVGIAVPVQLMVQSEVSGVMFTIEPVTSNKKTLIIEAVYGLGEMIVSGQTTPDHYEIDKKNMTITKKNIVIQDKQMVRSGQGNKIVSVSKAYEKEQKLPDEKILELAALGIKIEKHYFFPQDIEWAFAKNDLYIVQARPVTTISKTLKTEKIENEIKIKNKILLQGAPGSPIIGTGKVTIIKSPAELSKIKKGDVLVTEMTNPDYVPAMKKAIAIVTDRGGRTSHAAIVARELGVACVTGTSEATKKLKDGQMITVDGLHGIIYEGQILKKGTFQINAKKSEPTKVHKTATKLYVNLAEPDLAPQIAAKNVDGVGLLRAEFMLAQIGTHPKKFIEDEKSDVFVDRLADGLAKFGKAFGTRPVIYRATDLKSNEYKDLIGGEKFEPLESNPMLGYRGAFRYIKDPDVFKLELEALGYARKKHKNLHLMIPFVRNTRELKEVRQLVTNSGLFEDPSFQFWMMVEIPANVILLEDFIKVGIDGVSIGSNDLTMLILGTDRDNEEVASEFQEMDKSVLWALEKTVKTAARSNISCSICGQAPSIFPDLTQMLVSWGITSVSVNPDAIEPTRDYIYEAEEKLTKAHG